MHKLDTDLFVPCGYRYLVAAVCLLCSFALGAATLTDPTRPPQLSPATVQKRSVQQSEYRLSSIRIRSGSKTAVLNGQSVTEGQSVGEAVIRKIESGRVILSLNGERREVPLFAHTLKKQYSKVP